MVLSVIVIFLLNGSIFCDKAQADDVSDSIQKAADLYKQKEYSEAIAELNFAITQINSKLTELYKATFQPALEGYTEGKAEGNSMSVALLGGGITVTRKDLRSSGGSLTMELTANSPILSSIMVMMSNPIFLGDKKLVTINGEKAIKEWDEENQNGQLQIPVDNQVLLTFTAVGVPYADLLATGENFRYDDLRALIKK